MSPHEKIRFFSLLFVDGDNTKHANLRAGHEDPIDIYIECASTLAQSLKASGSSLAVLTNDEALIRERMARLALPPDFEVTQLAFNRKVPRGIPFYSAHFKLDLFRYFGACTEAEPICLLDGDTVLLTQPNIDRTLEDGLIIYDIVGQLAGDCTPAELLKDIEAVGGTTLDCVRWYGGEFILGRPIAFSRLADKVDQIWPKYLDAINSVRHVGDEMVVTAALTRLQAEGMKLLDAGQAKLISRWWTARTNSRQVPFSVAAKSNILHLPSDKLFLRQMARRPFISSTFLTEYRRYARSRLLGRRLANPLLNAVSRKTKFVGSL